MTIKFIVLLVTTSPFLLGNFLQGMDAPTKESILVHCQTIAHDPSSRHLRAFNAVLKGIDAGTLHTLECSQEILEAIQKALCKPLKVYDLPTLHTCLPKLSIQLHKTLTMAILSTIATLLESDPASGPYWDEFSRTVDDCEKYMYLFEKETTAMAVIKTQIKSHTEAPLAQRMQSLTALCTALIAET